LKPNFTGMKKVCLLIVLFPLLTFAQHKRLKRSEVRADKQTLINLKLHVAYLADDQLEGRRTGTKGELLAMDYIVNQFKKAGLEPKGTRGFVQEFTIYEGRYFDTAATIFKVDDEYLKPGKDFFPLAWSGAREVVSEGSPPLNEKGLVWFINVADEIASNKQNPHFDMLTALKNKTKAIEQKGAKAIVFYNNSASVDNVLFNRFDTGYTASFPVFYLRKDAFKKYFSDLTAMYDLKLAADFFVKSRQARNVVGYINNDAPTTIVVGAHYDHLGYGEDGNSLDGLHEIHNGADDNASGTAALIELARILKLKAPKNNNYLFIAFSGEELGLYGSKYWLDNRTVSGDINYMINMDMIGRYDAARKLTIGGYGTSPVWSSILSSELTSGLVVNIDSSGAGPSDHASFYRKDIPVLFFFTNSHSDYHKTTDDADKINYNGQLQIVKLVSNIVMHPASANKLAFLKTAEQQMKGTAFKVSLGVIPDYAYTGTGLRIEGVSKGKVAEQAGLKAGDVLLQLGEYKFVDIQSYMQALSKFQHGDKAKLIISRDGKQLTFDIEFQ